GAERRVTNVAAGSGDTDAVNVSQLKAVDGKVNNLDDRAVKYDVDPTTGAVNYNSATLGGDTYNTTTKQGGTVIHNVAAGTSGGDAVNVDQLNQQGSELTAKGLNFAGNSGAAVHTNLGDTLMIAGAATTAGTYSGNNLKTVTDPATGAVQLQMADAPKFGTVTINEGGSGKITGVTAGTDATDAVNVSQLTQVADSSVKYDVDPTTGTVNYNSVTLGGDTYNSTTKTGGTVIHNVAAGTSGGDAVNVDQLNASKTHYYSVNDNGVQGGNYANDGATGVNALAAGVGAKATADGGVALGSGSVASTAAGVAGFVPQSASTAQGAAIAATTSTLGAVSVGDAANGQFRQITGVAAGTADSDAVNVAQLKGVDQKVDNLDNNAVKYDDSTHNSVTLGGDTYNTTTRQGGTVIHNVAAGTSGGDAVNVDQLNTTVDASKTHYYSVNDGGVQGANYANDGATGLNSLAAGIGASASVAGGVALGSGSLASTAGGIAGWVPVGADTTLANAVMNTMGTTGVFAVGNPAAGVYRQITGVAAGTTASDAVNVAQLQAAISSVNTSTTPTTDDRAVKYDGASGSPKDHVTLEGTTSTDGGQTGGTTISNVHQGDVSANSTDAVNGAQLYQTNTRVDNLETTVNNWGDVINKTEGNTRYFQADGTNTDADKAYVQAGTKGVASGANASVTGNNGVAMGNTASASGNNSTAIGANSTATHDNSVALGAGSTTDRANSVSVGSAGNERQITNVAAGTAGTDAVNVNQLNTGVSQANQYTDMRINNVENSMNVVSRKAYAGVAAATALTMIPDVDKDKTLALGVGGGSYQGQHAVAIGATARVTENVKVRAGVGMSAGGTTVGVGGSMQW
ncbi:MAG: YadA-like family protein, partial [Pseudomonadota bacterium]